MENCWTAPSVEIWPMEPLSGDFPSASLKYMFPSVPTMIPSESW